MKCNACVPVVFVMVFLVHLHACIHIHIHVPSPPPPKEGTSTFAIFQWLDVPNADTGRVANPPIVLAISPTELELGGGFSTKALISKFCLSAFI